MLLAINGVDYVHATLDDVVQAFTTTATVSLRLCSGAEMDHVVPSVRHFPARFPPF